MGMLVEPWTLGVPVGNASRKCQQHWGARGEVTLWNEQRLGTALAGGLEEQVACSRWELCQQHGAQHN